MTSEGTSHRRQRQAFAAAGYAARTPGRGLGVRWRDQERYREALGAPVELRGQATGRPLITDHGNMTLDCSIGPIADCMELAAWPQARAGIVEHGLFLGLASDLITADKGEIRHLTREISKDPS